MQRPAKHPAAKARGSAQRLLCGALAGVAALGLGFSAHAGENLQSPRSVKPRPPLPPEKPFNPPLWRRHVDIGGDAAFVTRLASHNLDSQPSDIRYAPAIGYGFHARIELYRYLRASAWFLSARHTLQFAGKSPVPLGEGDFTVSSKSVPPVETMVFGAHLAPTLPWTSRARSWLTLGVGWGRMYMPRVEVASEHSFIHERSSTFVELPLGIGTSFDIIPRWLSIEIETTGAFMMRQSGEALEPAQAIDAGGRRRKIRALPLFDASFVHTLGLSIVL